MDLVVGGQCPDLDVVTSMVLAKILVVLGGFLMVAGALSNGFRRDLPRFRLGAGLLTAPGFERMLKANMGKPQIQQKALKKLYCSMTEEQLLELRTGIYTTFFSTLDTLGAPGAKILAVGVGIVCCRGSARRGKTTSNSRLASV